MKIIKCDECGGKLENKKIEFKLYSEHIGFFPATVCAKCGEELFDEKTSDDIDNAVKKKGLWGLGSHGKITQVGSSVALIINKKIVDFLGLKKGEDVYVYPQDKHRILVEITQ